MKFSVEQWQPEYGTPVDDLDNEELPTSIDLDLERDSKAWSGIAADPAFVLRNLLFVDGVRRIDARIWLQDGPRLTMGLCASCAAGVVRCDGNAHVEQAITRRIVIAPGLEESISTRYAVYEAQATFDDRVETLMNALAKALSSLEVKAAELCDNAPLVILDGPLRGRERIKNAIGYIKSHRVSYLPPDLSGIVPSLAPAERTPIFLVETSWTRYSWYMRLPGGRGHPWAGIVRCEAPPHLSAQEAIHIANTTAATLPAYASAPYKDGRAPQNLYPIKGLEDCLRSRLGSPELLYRSVLIAADSGLL